MTEQTLAKQTVRAIVPLAIPDIEPASLGDKPVMDWIELSALRINDAYQRSISNRSITSIRKMVRTFDWSRIKALSVVEMGDGTYEVIDGQHTAIAAMTHGDVTSLPCLISPPKTLEARAADFVGLNRDRLSMTPMQVFWAEVASKDELALEVVRGVQLGGGQLLRYPPGHGLFKSGDIVSTGALKKVANEGGPAWVRRVVSIGVNGKLAPIKAPLIRALVLLIWKGEHAGTLSDDRIIDLLRIYGQEPLLTKARVYRDTAKQPIGKCLAHIIWSLA